MGIYEIYRNFLEQFIQLKSISTDPQYKGECKMTAQWLSELFQDQGFEVEVVEGYENPIVVARYVQDRSLQTCLIYGHYDVQPAEKEDGWDSDPYNVLEKDGRLICRGAADNKGQLLIHVVNIFELINQKKLKYNVTFLIEGDEERGSPKLEQFIIDHKEKLACDFVMVSDGEIKGHDTPAIEIGFRGITNVSVVLRTSNTDLHSGIYGGISPNSAHEAAKLIDSFYDENHAIQIVGFYDDVLEITNEEKKNNESNPFDQQEYEQVTGCKVVFYEDGVMDTYTQTGYRPTLQITGLESGYYGEGYKTAIPAETTIKINFRLVPNQKPLDILKKFQSFVLQHVPDYVDVTFSDLEKEGAVEGVKLDLDNEFVKSTELLLEEVFDTKPIRYMVGGTIPLAYYFKKHIGVPQVYAGLANEDCNMHGVNENFVIETLRKGLEFSQKFFSKDI